MLKFSFLIATYNGAVYLKRLLDSLLQQDIPHEEYEILCLDDCSSDNSVEIVQEYSAKYPNVVSLRNKVNSRMATNVNYLVSIAKGKYFWIIGQDDYIAPNCLLKLWNKLEKDNLDVLLFNYRQVTTDEQTIREPKVFADATVQSGVSLIHNQFDVEHYADYLLGYEWRAIYRLQHWLEQNIRCVDGMNYEDTLIMFKAMLSSNRVASISDILYNYRVNSTSITFKNFYNRKGDYIYEFTFLVGQEEEDFLDQLKQYDQALVPDYVREIVWRYNMFVFDLIRTNYQQKKRFYANVRQNRSLVRSKKHWMNWKSKLFINPIIGMPLCNVAASVYRVCNFIKHM